MLVFNKDSCYMFYYWLCLEMSCKHTQLHTWRHRKGGKRANTLKERQNRSKTAGVNYPYEFIVKIKQSHISSLILWNKSLPTEKFKSLFCVCFLSVWATSVSSSAYLYFKIEKKMSDDKTESGAAACRRLHPGSVASVCSLIFPSFKRRSRSLHNTKIQKSDRRHLESSLPVPLCHPESMREKPQVENIMGVMRHGCRVPVNSPSLAGFVQSGFWQMVLSP